MLNINAHWIDQYCNNGTQIKTTLSIIYIHVIIRVYGGKFGG